MKLERRSTYPNGPENIKRLRNSASQQQKLSTKIMGIPKTKAQPSQLKEKQPKEIPKTIEQPSQQHLEKKPLKLIEIPKSIAQTSQQHKEKQPTKILDIPKTISETSQHKEKQPTKIIEIPKTTPEPSQQHKEKQPTKIIEIPKNITQTSQLHKEKQPIKTLEIPKTFVQPTRTAEIDKFLESPGSKKRPGQIKIIDGPLSKRPRLENGISPKFTEQKVNVQKVKAPEETVLPRVHVPESLPKIDEKPLTTKSATTPRPKKKVSWPTEDKIASVCYFDKEETSASVRQTRQPIFMHQPKRQVMPDQMECRTPVMEYEWSRAINNNRMKPILKWYLPEEYSFSNQKNQPMTVMAHTQEAITKKTPNTVYIFEDTIPPTPTETREEYLSWDDTEIEKFGDVEDVKDKEQDDDIVRNIMKELKGIGEGKLLRTETGLGVCNYFAEIFDKKNGFALDYKKEKNEGYSRRGWSHHGRNQRYQ